MEHKFYSFSRLLKSALMLMLVIVALTGCSKASKTKCNKTKEYQSSKSIEPLRVPGEMDKPASSGALAIPEASADAKVRTKSDPCLEAPPDYFDNKADMD